MFIFGKVRLIHVQIHLVSSRPDGRWGLIQVKQRISWRTEGLVVSSTEHLEEPSSYGCHVVILLRPGLCGALQACSGRWREKRVYLKRVGRILGVVYLAY